MPLAFFQGSKKKNNNNNNNVVQQQQQQQQIPVAVPIAYIPPPPPSTSMMMVPTTTTTSTSTSMYQQQPQQRAQQAPSSPFTNMIISNDELDHNLREFSLSLFSGRTLTHKLFIIVQIFTVLTAINNIIAHCIAVVFWGRKENSLEVVLRWLTILLYVLVILIELNYTYVVQKSYIFYHFGTRGSFYVFLGILSAVEYDIGQQNYYGSSYRDRYNAYYYGRNGGHVIYIPSGEDAIELYIWSTSWIMVSFGILYSLMGIFCLHQKYHTEVQLFYQRQQQSQSQQQQQAYTRY